ncbi:sulfatase-like hydrolase/transferase [Pseudoxanthomonas koreensis]|uniref:sulfatase-like hydrolase/transferase n=1 Tax=Pseudoxanthomonas koreensis TaxID=266061 RepID=UPI0035A6CB86
MESSERLGSSWHASFAIELASYALSVVVFLYFYVNQFHAPSAVIFPHLKVVLAVLAMPLGLRALAGRFIRNEWFCRGLSAFLILLPLVAIVFWYALVLIGLNSWGRVTTWGIIWAYAKQLPHLLGALGIPAWLPLSLSGMVLAVLFVFIYILITPRDWVKRLFRRANSGITILAAIALILTSLARLTSFCQGGGEHPSEPAVLSFITAKTGGLQSHRLADSAALDAKENIARSEYIAVQKHLGRNLILIVGDALRAGHMSVYGYERNTTPNLESLVRRHQGHVVPNVRSACAESSCGLMAIASSRPVSDLGSAPFTLQEVMRESGYRVHFVLGGDHTNFYGLRSMYGELDTYFDGTHQDVRYMNDDQLILDHLESIPQAVPGEASAFQFHLMSTHGLGERKRDCSPYQPTSNYYAWPGGSPNRPPTPNKAVHAVNYYDNGVTCWDSVIAKILQRLEEKGYLDDALVVITGDHGEMLGENGFFSHQYGLDEGVLDIPLVLLRYGYEGPDFPGHQLVGQIDIAPTILRELGLPAVPIWKGRALHDKWSPREIKIQQGPDFGIYHLSADGAVWKYRRNQDTGVDFVTRIEGRVEVRASLEDVPPELLVSWRSQAAASMLVLAHFK